MGAEVSQLIEFLYTVFTNWILLAGGAVMTVIGIGERLWRKEVHWKTYLGVLVGLLFVAFYMSWRDMRIALDAKPPMSQEINVNEKDPQARAELASTKEQLKEDQAVIQNLKSLADAEGEYGDIAALNMIGKPYPDGDIVFNTPISKALEGAYIIEGTQITYKKNSVAEQKFSDTIEVDPRFPFSYVGLGAILLERKDSGWRDMFIKAKGILEKTTQIPRHHPNHDLFLQKVKDVLVSNQFTQP